MSMIICEPWFAEVVRAQREAMEDSFLDEVWDGVYVVSPSPNNEHSEILVEFTVALRAVIDKRRGDRVYSIPNVSDREEGWTSNYRIPDLAVVLAGNPAKNLGTHWCGGPDLVVEVMSPGDLAREKRPFYAEMGVREMWVLDRDPWALELYRLDGGELELVGTSTPDNAGPALDSAVVPLTFRLVLGPDRPQVEIRTVDGRETWLA